jgi:hypothetical protein
VTGLSGDQTVVFLSFELTTPVTVAQGDIYVIFVDKSTDEGGTLLFWYTVGDGAPRTDRSILSVGTIGRTGGSLTLLNNLTYGIEEEPAEDGTFVVRGYGRRATAGTRITWLGEPTDTTLTGPSGLTATPGGDRTRLDWTPPDLPPAGDPTAVAEDEPNNGPRHSGGEVEAQNIVVNSRVSGRDRSTNTASNRAGFAEDDVEDWYRFTLATSSVVKLDLTFRDVDFDLFLYPANVTSSTDPDDAIATSGAAAGIAEHIEVELAAGTYLVGVSAFDPDVPNDTPYELTVLTPQTLEALQYYNIFRGSSSPVVPSPETFLGTAGPTATSFAAIETSTLSYYAVTAVIGGSQTNPSNTSASLVCEGGPTITTGVAEPGTPGTLDVQGSITLRGSGFRAGSQLLVDGATFIFQPKVNANGTKLRQRGPLTNGTTIADVCRNGCTVTVLGPSGEGCSTFRINP